MTLPLFPELPTPAIQKKTARKRKGSPQPSPAIIPQPIQSPVSIQAPIVAPMLVPPTTPEHPLSIRDITAIIHDQVRPLTKAGRRILHAQWLRPGINAGPRGFLSVTLADTEDSTISIDGFIWDRAEVQAFLQQGKAFGTDLTNREARCEVMLEVTIDYWPKKSKPYLRIHGLNQIGMKGLRQQQREATLRMLEQAGLIGRNATMPWARPGLRLFCIAKRDSDGYRDAIAILSQSGIGFRVTVHNVAVQGTTAIPTILAAFQSLAKQHANYDCLLLIRGGGSELDLLAFDDFAIAQAVATCPLPVITGLGHTSDLSLCDVVSAKALETPTAAARYLVDRILLMVEERRLVMDRIRHAAIQVVHIQRQALLAQRQTFVRQALSLLHRHQDIRVTRWHTLLTLGHELLHHHHRTIQQVYRPLRAHAQRVLDKHRTWLYHQLQSTLFRAPVLITTKRARLSLWRQALPTTAQTRLIGPTRLRLQGLRQRVHHVGTEQLHRTQSHLQQLHTTIQAMSPTRYFALGLSYVTKPDGQLVRQCQDVVPGETIHIHVRDGIIPTTANERTHDEG